jgi:uncharacterized protein (TIGR02996 family)
MWEPVALPKLPGRVVAASEPAGERFTIWTTAGVFILKIGWKPGSPAKLWEQLPPERGPERFDLAEGCFRWRGARYRMHGACGPDGQVVGKPLPAAQRLGQTVQRDGDHLLVRDISGAVRQVINRCGARARWSVAGFCGFWGEYLLVAHPGSVRLFRFAGSAEGGGALWQRAGDRSQQPAFLRAIAGSPDDDAPRLVYSDWLEEHGDPDRAEFIRVQCRIAEREQFAEVPFEDPDRQHAWQLSEANKDRWAAELPALRGVGYWFPAAFRGFPEITFRNPDDLLRHGDRIVAATPIEAVCFYRLPRQPLARLLKTSWLAQVCRLTVRNLPPGAEPGLAGWLTSPQAGRLRRLKLYNCTVESWTVVLQAVAASRHLGRLEEVRLGEVIPSHPDEGAVLALARSPHLPRLRYVEYHWWHLYPKRTKAELRRRFPAINLK